MTDNLDSKTTAQSSDENDDSKGFLVVALTTFTTVFIAEIGDKTQLATLLLSAQSGKPVTVFCGAALALISSSLVGVLLGQWLTKILAPERFEAMAGLMMLGLGLWIGIGSLNSLFIHFQTA
ncbi:TMEM165/GDT1 family protein [Prochlorococcus sp. MIT 1300]|uniref:TMEM165/GDT1 family protein n=1 Tax=Prochlorococcus sp. MIT 1300 TaxID=3096218 RepID=UPI002A752536|nr:TMEM165/GDT1 family protein [Prochlorococcus sp. MIT 1300]